MSVSLQKIKLSFKLIIFSTLILLLSYPISIAACDVPPSDEDVRNMLTEAFEAVLEAENAGGETLNLVDELNQALRLLDEGKTEEAMSIVDAVLAVVPDIKQAGLISTRNQQITVTGTLIFSAVSTAVVWRYGKKVFWLLWLRSKRGWKVNSFDRR